MNLSPRWLVTGLLLAGVPAAHGQSSVELSISGLLVPASCTPSFGVEDVRFGKVSVADLDAGRHTSLGLQPNALNIFCAQPTLFALRAHDNRQDSVHGQPGTVAPMGLGLTPSREKLGAWHLELVSRGSSIDAKVVYFTLGGADGRSWSPASRADTPIHSTGPLLGLVDTHGVASGPSLVKTALLRIQVSGHIAPAAGLTLNDEVPLDGQATIELVYL